MTKLTEKLRDRTVLYAGPAVLETFGSAPFCPAQTPHAPRYDEAQQKICTDYDIKAAQLYSDAVVAKDRSFTIIDFPLPSIAETDEEYREIFDAVIQINTLDSSLYEKIQSRMIDVLNSSSFVHVRGRNGNRTEDKTV